MEEIQKLFYLYYSEISIAITFLIGLLIYTLRSYLSEKGKLKAQISENKKLVEQTESIKSKYSIELEDIKKNHQLEISKRKYQYEAKKDIYIKFFKLLDEFSSKNNSETQAKFLPILEEFNRNYLQSSSKINKSGETKAINVFQKKIQALLFEANNDLIRLKQETNTIRLLASDEVVKKLDLLTFAFDKSMEDSNKMMNNLLQLMLSNDQLKMNENQRQLELTAQIINKIKEEIIELMRNELNNI